MFKRGKFGKLIAGLAMLITSIMAFFVKCISPSAEVGFLDAIGPNILDDAFFSIPKAFLETFSIIRAAAENKKAQSNSLFQIQRNENMALMYICMILLLVGTIMIILSIFNAVKALYREFGCSDTKGFYESMCKSCKLLLTETGSVLAILFILSTIAKFATGFAVFSPTLKLVILCAILVIIRNVYLPMIRRLYERPDEAVSDFSLPGVIYLLCCIWSTYYIFSSFVVFGLFGDTEIGLTQIFGLYGLIAFSKDSVVITVYILTIVCLIAEFIAIYYINKYFSFMNARDRGIMELADSISVTAVCTIITVVIMFIETLIINSHMDDALSLKWGSLIMVLANIAVIIFSRSLKETKRVKNTLFDSFDEEPSKDESIDSISSVSTEPEKEDTDRTMSFKDGFLRIYNVPIYKNIINVGGGIIVMAIVLFGGIYLMKLISTKVNYKSQYASAEYEYDDDAQYDYMWGTEEDYYNQNYEADSYTGSSYEEPDVKPEPVYINPFDYLSVEFDGVSGRTKVKLNYTGEYLTENDFNISQEDHLNILDEITVSINDISGAEEDGYIFEQTEQTYTVGGVPEAIDLYNMDLYASEYIEEEMYQNARESLEQTLQRVTGSEATELNPIGYWAFSEPLDDTVPINKYYYAYETVFNAPNIRPQRYLYLVEATNFVATDENDGPYRADEITVVGESNLAFGDGPIKASESYNQMLELSAPDYDNYGDIESTIAYYYNDPITSVHQIDADESGSIYNFSEAYVKDYCTELQDKHKYWIISEPYEIEQRLYVDMNNDPEADVVDVWAVDVCDADKFGNPNWGVQVLLPVVYEDVSITDYGNTVYSMCAGVPYSHAVSHSFPHASGDSRGYLSYDDMEIGLSELFNPENRVWE